MAMNRCVKCQSEDIDRGWILSAGKVYYKSDVHKSLLMSARCKTFVCVNCGYSETYVDPGYFAKLRAKNDQ